MIYYHGTTASAAAAILEAGFRDHVGRYLTDHDHAGVWLSDVSLEL